MRTILILLPVAALTLFCFAADPVPQKAADTTKLYIYSEGGATFAPTEADYLVYRKAVKVFAPSTSVPPAGSAACCIAPVTAVLGFASVLESVLAFGLTLAHALAITATNSHNFVILPPGNRWVSPVILRTSDLLGVNGN